MTVARTRAVAVMGIEGTLVDVEADVSPGLPAFTLGGLPDAACRQAPDRIRAAVSNSELELPRQRITVNMSPADLPKQGSAFDLAIALAVLAVRGVVDAAFIDECVHLGELGLDGTVRPVPGVLPAVLAAAAGGVRTVVVPVANATEAQLVDGVQVIPARSLTEVVNRYRCMARRKPVPDLPPIPPPQPGVHRVPDLVDVVGQPEARYAVEVAAAGGHHMAMIGPPGAGKTMIAERLPGILPALERQVALEVTAVHSVLGELTGDVLVRTPPFVAPHHGASMAAVIGGGSGRVRPGAVSRAHGGILFLDECPEFRRDVLDGLRQPLEAGFVHVLRLKRAVRYPARFQLVLAANPCPCGLGGGKGEHCQCSAMMRRGYLDKLSGPLMDRIDVQLQMRAVTRAALAGPPGETSATVAARVLAARERQRRRWQGMPWSLNGHASGSVLRSQFGLGSQATRPLDQQLDRGSLTLRGYDRCLRLAWTLGDLEGVDRPGPQHVLSALGLRMAQVAA